MKFVENPGFYFEIGACTTQKTNVHSINKLPSLEEFGSSAIHFKGENYFWVFYTPSNPSPLDFTVFEDSNDKVVLFCGSLYSQTDSKKIATNLLKANTVEALSSVLRDFSGVFSGLVHFKTQNTTFAFVDQFGVKKLFYGDISDKLIFTSHIMLASYYNNISEVSRFAFGSILFSGHIFCDSVFDGISQVNAACLARIQESSTYESEYVLYPSRQKESFRSSVQRVKEAHLDFWQRMCTFGIEDITLLLSRGKDARVVLKYLLESGITPNLLSFFRKNNAVYPFVSFLLEATDDFKAACCIRDTTGLSLTELNIPNHYLLDNLDRIITLNHGTPLHWEFLAAAAAVTKMSDFSVTGFLGDAIAGKSHHYYLFKKVRFVRDYATIEFNNAGFPNAYDGISRIVNSSAIANTPAIEALYSKWLYQYSLCKSDDINIIFQQGLIRTRVLGRVGPTFDQMRLFTRPIYPYNDNRIISAYRSIPEKYLIWEKAHVAQLTSDKRFNSVNTTRLQVSVKNELKFLRMIGLLRRFDTVRKHAKRKSKTGSPSKDYILRKTLQELGVENSIWSQFDKLPRTQGFYSTITNLISALRIRESLSKAVPTVFVHDVATWGDKKN